MMSVLLFSDFVDNPEATLGYQVNLTCSWIDRSPHQGGARKTKTECFEIDGKVSNTDLYLKYFMLQKKE